MKTMKKITVILAIFSIVLTATAQDGRSRRSGGGDHPGQFAPGPQRPDGHPARPMPQGPGQPGMEPPMGGIDIERHIQMLTRALDLTPEQQEAIKEILDKNRDTARAHRDTIRKTSQELRKAVMDGDPKTAKKLAQTLADAMVEQAVGQAGTMQAVNNELTDEQLEKLEEIKHQMRQRIEQRRQGEGQGQWQRPRQGQGPQRFAPQPPRDEFDDEPLPPQRPRQRRQPRPDSAD